MTLGDRRQWAQAFMLQASLDLDLAKALYGIARSRNTDQYLGSRPELYLPAIYAYSQQAIEKAVKAWLWYSEGRIPRKHNPLKGLLSSSQMKGRNRPQHLENIDRNKKSIGRILDMAPGASLDNPRLEDLLKQPNTEYPFGTPSGGIKLPYQEISDLDVAQALKIANPLVISIQKSLEVAGLALIYTKDSQ